MSKKSVDSPPICWKILLKILNQVSFNVSAPRTETHGPKSSLKLRPTFFWHASWIADSQIGVGQTLTTSNVLAKKARKNSAAAMDESSLTVTSVTQEKENIDAVSTEPSDTSMFKEMLSEGISSWIYGFYHEKTLASLLSFRGHPLRTSENFLALSDPSPIVIHKVC